MAAGGQTESEAYRALGVSPGVSDAELHAAYRKLVQRHHPDHNGGSADATRRFQEIQEAYGRVKELRKQPQRARPRAADPSVESRVADLERELREAHAARERARQAARDAVAGAGGRPSDDELGYVSSEDSFSKILADARTEATKRVSGLIAGLEDLTSRFNRPS